MKSDEKLDQSLKNLNKDIIWSKGRQQHIRNKLINNMRQEKVTRISRIRRKIVPVTCILLTIAIFMIIILSEFGTNDVATENDVSKRTANGNANNQTEIIKQDDKQELIKKDHNNTDTDANDTSENNSLVRLLTQSEIMTAIKGQMTSDLPIKLPSEVNLPEGKRLTAATSSNKNSYEVIFYQHDEPISINNKLLFSNDNPAEVIARVHAKRFDTQEQVDKAISYEVFDESNGDSIKLRETLTGYRKTSGSSVRTGWNIGRWALTTHALSDDKQRDVLLAKEIIAYLDLHFLPAPKQNGYAYLDADHVNNQIVWANGKTVYTIDQITDPFKALDMAVNFE